MAGLITIRNEPIEPSVNNIQGNSTSIERVLSNQELDSLDDTNSRVVLVKIGDSSHSVLTLPGRSQPSNFPIGTTSGYPTPHVNPYRIPPKLVFGAPGNLAGAGNGGHKGHNGGGAAEFDNQCPVPKKEQSQESETFNYDYHSNTQQNKDKKKKRRNSHLDRQVEINGHNFEIERAQVEKKTPRHGVDLGLNPDIGADGKPILDQKTQKPMAKANKENSSSALKPAHFRLHYSYGYYIQG